VGSQVRPDSLRVWPSSPSSPETAARATAALLSPRSARRRCFLRTRPASLAVSLSRQSAIHRWPSRGGTSNSKFLTNSLGTRFWPSNPDHGACTGSDEVVCECAIPKKPRVQLGSWAKDVELCRTESHLATKSAGNRRASRFEGRSDLGNKHVALEKPGVTPQDFVGRPQSRWVVPLIRPDCLERQEAHVLIRLWVSHRRSRSDVRRKAESDSAPARRAHLFVTLFAKLAISPSSSKISWSISSSGRGGS
jgi:hypothetical protein